MGVFSALQMVVFFYINTFGKTENMFGYRVMDYLYKYMRDTFLKDCEVDDKMRKKEEILVEYFSKYLFTCISHHYSEQSFNTCHNRIQPLSQQHPGRPAQPGIYHKLHPEKPTRKTNRPNLTAGAVWGGVKEYTSRHYRYYPIMTAVLFTELY